jgi:hypothetical protein
LALFPCFRVASMAAGFATVAMMAPPLADDPALFDMVFSA